MVRVQVEGKKVSLSRNGLEYSDDEEAKVEVSDFDVSYLPAGLLLHVVS